MTITKGTRVEQKRTGKVGTAIEDSHDIMGGGQAVYVRWDGSTRPPLATNVRNLIVLEG